MLVFIKRLIGDFYSLTDMAGKNNPVLSMESGEIVAIYKNYVSNRVNRTFK